MKERIKDEVLKTPRDLRKILDTDHPFDELPDPTRRSPVLLTGSGSSYHVATYTAALLNRELGTPAIRYPGKTAPWIDNTDLAYVISMSGGKDSHRIAKALNCEIIAVTCEPESPLAQHADHLLHVPLRREPGFLNTRTIVSTMLLMALYTQHLGADIRIPNDLPERLEETLQEPPEETVKTVQERKKIIYVGDGYQYIAAQQAALKSIEVGDANAIAVTSDELFHGRFFGDQRKRVYVVLNPQAEKILRERAHEPLEVITAEDLGAPITDPDDPTSPVTTLPHLYLLIDKAYGPVDTSPAGEWWNKK